MQIDKFLNIESPSAGGVGRYIATLSSELTKLGHEVDYFGTVSHKFESKLFPEYYDYKKTRNPLALFRMIRDGRAAKKLADWLANKSFDIAHLHNIYHHLTPAILPVLKQLKIPTVLTLHDYRLACPARHFYRKDGLCTRCVGGKFYHAVSSKCAGFRGIPLAIETAYQYFTRIYLKNISTFICPTGFMKSIFERNNFSANKLKVIRNIVAPVETVELDFSQQNILYVGRLSYEKGVDLLLEIAQKLPTNCQILIAGDGPESETLTKKIADNNLSNVTLLGHMSADLVSQLYKQANIVVVPSRCMENSPASMLEAMQAGRVVIAPDQPEIKEWIEDSQTGLLFRTGESSDLLRACKLALSSPELMCNIANAAREKVLIMNNTANHISQILEVYKKAASL